MLARLQAQPLTPILFTFSLFAVFTVVMTWPLTRYIGSSVQDLGDPLYQTWTLRWIQHQLVRDPLDLWNANTAYPFEMSLLYSEPHISTALLHWPIVAITGNDILGYNLLVLASFVTTGAGMALFIRELTGSLGAGIVSGTLAAFAPYRFGHMSHLNLLSYGWLMLALWLLARFMRTRRLRDAAGASAFLVIQFHASDTMGAFSLIVLSVFLAFAIWHKRLHRDTRFLVATGTAMLVPLITFVPVILGRLEVNRLYGFERTLDDVRAGAAVPRDFLSVHPFNHFWADLLPIAYPNPLYPGLLAVALAGAGVFLAPQAFRPWILGGGLLVVIGGVMAIGPELRIRSLEIPMVYRFFFEHVPGASSMRDVARFGMLSLLGIHILAGLGVAILLARLPRQIAGIDRAYLSAGAVALACLVALVEFRTEVGAVEVDRSPERLAVYEWLADQPEGPVLEFPADGHWTNLSRSIQPMYYSTWHWRPVIAAYASFVPPEHVPLLLALHGGPDVPSRVTEENIGLIQDLKVRYLVIHHHIDEYDSDAALQEAHELNQLTYAGTFGHSSAFVIDLRQREPTTIELAGPPRARPGEDLVIAAVSWNRNPSPALASIEQGDQIVAKWFTRDGDLAESQTYDRSIILAVPTGVSGAPITIRAPDVPNDYILELFLGHDETASARIELEVAEHPTGPDQNADIWVHSFTGLDERYAPGDWIQITASWEITGEPDPGMVATVQLLDDAGGGVAQWDGWPYGENYQGERLPARTPFVTPFALEIPAELPAGDYQLLVALYDYLSEGAPRYELRLPDGSDATQFMAPVRIE